MCKGDRSGCCPASFAAPIKKPPSLGGRSNSRFEILAYRSYNRPPCRDLALPTGSPISTRLVMSKIETVMNLSLCDVPRAPRLCKASHGYLPQNTRARYPMSTPQFVESTLTILLSLRSQVSRLVQQRIVVLDASVQD